jgi:hypothetical protein
MRTLLDRESAATKLLSRPREKALLAEHAEASSFYDGAV